MAHPKYKKMFYALMLSLCAFTLLAPEECPKNLLSFCERIEVVGLVNSEKKGTKFYYYTGIFFALIFGIAGSFVSLSSQKASNELLKKIKPTGTLIQKILANTFMTILILLPYFSQAENDDSIKFQNFTQSMGNSRFLSLLFIEGIFLLYFFIYLFISLQLQNLILRKKHEKSSNVRKLKYRQKNMEGHARKS